MESRFTSRRRSRTESRTEGLSGSLPQMMYASSIDLSNTFARSDYFSDINPRSMRRLMNIVSVTGTSNENSLACLYTCWGFFMCHVKFLFGSLNVRVHVSIVDTINTFALPHTQAYT